MYGRKSLSYTREGLSVVVSQIDNCIIITFLDLSLIQNDFIAWLVDLPGKRPVVDHIYSLYKIDQFSVVLLLFLRVLKTIVL